MCHNCSPHVYPKFRLVVEPNYDERTCRFCLDETTSGLRLTIQGTPTQSVVCPSCIARIKEA